MEASHIARKCTESVNLVTGVSSDEHSVTITWHDGHQSVFHTIWLRDNCSCDSCGDHSGGHRFFELNMMSDELSNHVSLNGNVVKIVLATRSGSTPLSIRNFCPNHFGPP